MKKCHFIIMVVSLIGIILSGRLGTGVDAQEQSPLTSASTRPQDFLDYINNRPSFHEHHTWGVFLGTGWHEGKLWQIEEWKQEEKWINPFTGKPFPEDTRVFIFGHANPALEGLRIVSDHLEIHAFSSWEELEGQHFDFGICHSNGCTNAINAHRQGLMRVEQFFTLGTDWTAKDFQPGDLQGAGLTLFAMKGDPIWKIPAPEWARMEDGAGLKFSIPFDRPQDIPTGLRNLLTQGRADPDRFPVIFLHPPSRSEATLLNPLRAHTLMDSYLKALGQWMQSDGSLQKAIARQIRQRFDPITSDEPPPIVPFPPGCPGCGGGGGPGSPGSSFQGPGRGGLPSTPGMDRGGISVDIHINPSDFQSP
jgi:hypothetical protein